MVRGLWFGGFGDHLGEYASLLQLSAEDRCRKKRARFLLVNLAVTRFNGGLNYCPTVHLCNWRSVLDDLPPLLSLSLKLWTAITGLASIFSISVISLERLFSIGWPIRHRNSTIRPYIAAITMTWLYAGVVPTLQTVFQLFSFETYAHVVVLIAVNSAGCDSPFPTAFYGLRKEDTAPGWVAGEWNWKTSSWRVHYSLWQLCSFSLGCLSWCCPQKSFIPAQSIPVLLFHRTFSTLSSCCTMATRVPTQSFIRWEFRVFVWH